MGGRIKHKRILAGMTQENLAELMYVKHGLISQYENNVVQPSVDKLQEIARILETSVGYLVDGVEAISLESEQFIELEKIWKPLRNRFSGLMPKNVEFSKTS